jgi:hypothetical protein
MMICKSCGTAQHGALALPGSGWIEFILWLCCLVPGLIYSIWRRSKRSAACSACGSRELVNTATPIGQALAKQHYPDGLPKLLPIKVKAPAFRPGFVKALVVIFVVAAFMPWLFRGGNH